MKKDYISHLFVPPEKSTTEKIADAIDDKLPRLYRREKSPRRTVKEIKDKMILHNSKKS